MSKAILFLILFILLMILTSVLNPNNFLDPIAHPMKYKDILIDKLKIDHAEDNLK